MNNRSFPIMGLTLIFITSLMMACSERLDSHAGIEGTGDTMASKGVVTKLGSIYVNGIHFKTDTAEIYVNGELTSEDAILPGMVVVVDGISGAEANEAYAYKVTFDYLVSGPIEQMSIDAEQNLNLQVLGYQVMVSENTVFKDTGFDQLKMGDIISVSGLELAPNSIVASQIKLHPATEDTLLFGYITNLSVENQQFSIHGVTITFTDATITNSEHGTLKNADLVQVKGSLNPLDQTLHATSISIRSPFKPEQNTLVTEEGFVSHFISSRTFILNNITVNASEAQVTGGSLEQLRERTHISAQGVFRDGVLQANSLQLILPVEVRTSGAVSSVDFRQQTLVVGDLKFVITPYTLFDDRSDYANRYFNLRDIRIGDNVDVFAHQDNNLTAITVRRKPTATAPFTMKGQITDITPEGNLYLKDILVLLDHIPLDMRWDFTVGQAIFIIGKVLDNQTIQADAVFPAIDGCTQYEREKCDFRFDSDRMPAPPRDDFFFIEPDFFHWEQEPKESPHR